MMKKLSDWEPYENYYHFIGATKYRKQLFYADDIRNRADEIIREILESKGVEVTALTVAYNHIHVLLKTELEPSQVGQVLFGASSRKLRKEFPILVTEAEKGLWGGRSWTAIKNEDHLTSCRSYILRHRPDNTKLYD